MKVPYDRSYAPPAPRIEIRLGVPDEAFRSRPLTALVDTGADATIVPAQHIEPLGVQIDNRKVLRSPWGERYPVNVYLLDVGIGDLFHLQVPTSQALNDSSATRQLILSVMYALDGIC